MNEWISIPAKGHYKLKHTNMYAEVHVVIEPIYPAQNEIIDKIGIPPHYFDAIKSGVSEALANGIIQSSQFSGVRVQIVDGSSHNIDSNCEAFRIAGLNATIDALRNAKPYAGDIPRNSYGNNSHNSDSHNEQHRDSYSNKTDDLDSKYASVLGLTGDLSAEKVKLRWRELAKQYHPDNVQHLGPKLREVAEQEMKAINQAYAYFQKKYGL